MTLKNDLRIGNFVKDATLGLCQITGIYNKTAWVYQRFGDEKEVSIEELEPVELSTDWLLAFSFLMNNKRIKQNGKDWKERKAIGECFQESWTIEFPTSLTNKSGSQSYFTVYKDYCPNCENIKDKYTFFTQAKQQVTYQKAYVHVLQNMLYQIFHLDIKIKDFRYIDNKNNS